MDAHRAFVYRYLSCGFAYPERVLWQALAAGLEDLARSLQALCIQYPLDAVKAELQLGQERLPDVQGEYNALFATELTAPPFETAYELDKAGRKIAELADIQGFYHAFGIAVTAPVQPDSVIAELEFLGLLLAKKQYAEGKGDSEGQAICTDAYEAFLVDHPGRWFTAFAERLEASAEQPFYRHMGRLLVLFLNQEPAPFACRMSRLNT
jgi:TorA maturation chaperone TorD